MLTRRDVQEQLEGLASQLPELRSMRLVASEEIPSELSKSWRKPPIADTPVDDSAT